MQYAIDFGTSNTVVVRWNTITQRAEIVKLPGLSSLAELIPSLVYIKNLQQSEALVGQQVINEGLDIAHNPRFFSNFKRGIGSKIQGFLPELDGQNVTLETVGKFFLDSIIKKLDPEAQSLILTVPVDSFESYRNWLVDIHQSWNIKDISLLDEPTAAALGYQQNQARKILVFDFGGGTLDISIVDLHQGSNQKLGFLLSSNQKLKRAKIIAKFGTNLGGVDIDNWLFEYFHKTTNIARSSLTMFLVEKIKIKLSQSEQAEEFYFDSKNLETYDLQLNQSQYLQILEEHGFISTIKDSLEKVLAQASSNGLTKEEIEAVLLVGGSSQIPWVKDCLAQYFPREKIHRDHSLDAVAKGALSLGRKLEVDDFLYHSYGVRYWDRRKNQHSWHTLIKAGQTYPTEKPFELTLGASLPNQTTIELVIGEIGQDINSREVYLDQNQLVTRQLQSGSFQVQPLNDQDDTRAIAQLNPPGIPGTDRLKIEFQVDKERFLRISVEDIFTGETLTKDQIVVRVR